MPDERSGLRDERVFAPTALTSRRPPAGRWWLLIAGVLLLVVVKPWASLEDGAGRPRTALAGSERTVPPAATPSAAPTASPEDAVTFCLQPGAWLVATRETYRSKAIRVWTAVEPIATATGPADPAIPVVPVVSEGVAAMGWCAPTHGPDRPGGTATVDAWLVADGRATPLRLTRSEPRATASSFGALYAPLDDPLGTWPDGRYVLRYREGTIGDRWFAIDIERRPHLPDAPGSGAPPDRSASDAA